MLEPLPKQVETWLIEPLKAPGFSLPDLTGELRDLTSAQGSFVLLNIWATIAPASLDQLKTLNQHRAAFTSSHLAILAVNVDTAAEVANARSFAAQERFAFPVLFSTEEFVGIYDIIYRHLFDRHRDLGIPTSFLLDREGMIIKVYQGPVSHAQLLEDVKSVPITAADRMRRALPFKGTLVQDAFLRNDFTYGVSMFQHGYLAQAAESFQQVISAKPDNADAYYNLGTLNLRKNDFEQAKAYLEQTVKLRPNYPEAWNNLGMIAAQQGRPDEAIQNFDQSLSYRPGYAIALLNLGNVYRRQGSLDKAEESLTHAIQLQPNDPEINYSLGMLSAQQNKMKLASDYLHRAIDLRPNYPEAINNLGVLFVRLHDYAKAEEQFKAGMQIAPGFDQSYINLARLYAIQNEKEKARVVLQDLLRVHPQNQGATRALEMLQ